MEEKMAKEEKEKTSEQACHETGEAAAAGDTCSACEEAREAAAPQRDFEAELAQLGDQMLRLAAEYDNYRKRSQKEKDSIYSDAVSSTVLSLLPVIDDFERAIAVKCEDESFYKGMLMVKKKFEEYLKRLGITEIPTEGTFDPTLHNAVVHTEDPGLPPNTIKAVMQKGYMHGSKVIRHTLVSVAN